MHDIIQDGQTPICAIHDVLMKGLWEAPGLRKEQVQVLRPARGIFTPSVTVVENTVTTAIDDLDELGDLDF